MIQFGEYPIQDELCRDYRITVNGLQASAVSTRVSAMPFNRLWPGQQRPLEQTEFAAYLSLFTDEPSLTFTIPPTKHFRRVTVRPLSAGVVPCIDGSCITFTLPGHGYYTVELDGVHNALHLLIDPIHHFNLPDSQDSLLYFGPGVHHAGQLELKSDTTVFIHRDAVVYGSILAVNARNIRILGEGVLDGSFYERQTDDFLLAYDFARTPEANWERKQMQGVVDGREDCFSDLSAYQNGSGTWIYRDDAQFRKLLETMKPVRTG